MEVDSILKRKVKVKKEPILEETEPEQIANYTPVVDPKKNERDITPVQQDPHGANVVGQMIAEKKSILSEEKIKLSSLESTIKKYCSEIEALEYIASGEPQMSIMNLLDMFQDFNDEIGDYESAQELLEDMEKTVLESTMQHRR